MANPWYPGATQDPGAAAGYKLSTAAPPYVKQTSMEAVGCHYTAGYSSRGLIRDQGLAQFLVSRDGTVWQFAEANAVCYQMGNPWNGRGPGIEIEYRDEPEIFTDAARTACAGLVKWLNTEWGIPLAYYDGQRVNEWNGFIAHRAVIEDADQHTDFWPQADWDLMVAAPTPPTPPTLESEEDTQMISQLFGPDGLLYITVVGQAGNVFVTKIHPDKVPDQGSPKTVENYAELTGFVGCPTPSGWK